MKTLIKKNILSLTVVVILLFNFSISSFAANLNGDSNNLEKDLERATNVLLQAGWTQEEINDLLTEEALLEYKDAQAVEVSERKYFKVTSSGDIFEVTEHDCTMALEQRILAAYQTVTNAREAGESSVGVMAIIPGGQTVYDEVLTTDGYLEYYVSAYNCGNDEYILSARYEWIINPYFTQIDVFGLGHCDGLTQLGSHEDVYYVYKADITINFGGGIIRDYYIEETTPTVMEIDAGGTVVAQDMLPHMMFSVNKNNMTSEWYRGFIQYRAKVNSSTTTVVSIFAEYLHQQAAVSVSPSISYPLGGSSISITYENKFERMSPNPYLAFDV